MNRPAARFGNLYPSALSENDQMPDVFPAPVTAFACKSHGDRHDLQDALREWLRGAPRSTTCMKCPARLERYRSVVGYPGKVPLRPLLRVGMNRLTEAAQDQALYTLEAIQPQANPKKQLLFTGYWQMTDTQWKQLGDLLNKYFPPGVAKNEWRLRIGSARARGLGEALLRVQDVTTPSLSSDLAARLGNFQKIAPDSERLYFSLTARSPVLVYNELGVVAMKLTLDILQAYGTALPAGIAERGVFVEHDWLSGWSQAWGLPKPVGQAMAAGSVFVYSVPQTERQSLLRLLEVIETSGLGERRSEGFGELVACDPFHLEHASVN